MRCWLDYNGGLGSSRLEVLPDSPAVQPPAALLLLKLSPSCLACPVLLRAALQEEGRRRRCCCSAAAMPVVTDLEYDTLIMGQPPQSHQMLVVCVTPPHQPVSTASESGLDVLDHLYQRMNEHRTAPCTQVQTLFLLLDLHNLVALIKLPYNLCSANTPAFLCLIHCLIQCQLDSFRLLRYEMPAGFFSWGLENFLLYRRHHAAPGMFLVSGTLQAADSARCMLSCFH